MENLNLRERAIEAYNAESSADSLRVRLQLKSEISRVLGIEVPLPDANSVTIDGLTFSMSYRVTGNPKNVLNVNALWEHDGKAGQIDFDLVQMSNLGEFLIYLNEMNKNGTDDPDE